MSYMIWFILLTSGYLFGAPIFDESLQFRVIECIDNGNETLSKHIIEITNINETCVRVNMTTLKGQEVFVYVVPETQIGLRVEIPTENCTTPLLGLHFSLCDEPSHSNQTGMMINFDFNNGTFPNILIEENNSTIQTIPFTGPVVFETLHRLIPGDDDDDDDHVTTNAPSNDLNQVSTTSNREE